MGKINKLFCMFLINMMLISSFAVNKLNPKVIIFDAAGTLIKVNRDCLVLFKEVFKQNKWEYNQEIENKILALAKEHAAVSFMSGFLCNNKVLPEFIPFYKQIFRDLCKEIGHPLSDEKAYYVYKQFLDLAHSANSPIYELFPNVIEVLKKLKSAGYRLALISNWDSSLREILKKFEISDYFEEKILSGEYKCEKPSAEIFEIILKEINFNKKEDEIVTAKDVVYVGDTVRDDIIGPQNFGMQPILITTGTLNQVEAIPHDLKDKVPVVHAFKELLGLFKGTKNLK